MHCPNVTASTTRLNGACPACGLLLLNFKPTRRAEDLATKKRRKDDLQAAAMCRSARANRPRRRPLQALLEIVDDDY